LRLMLVPARNLRLELRDKEREFLSFVYE